MSFYILLTILLILVGLAGGISKASNKLILGVIAFTVLFFISTVRDGVGSDFDTYKAFYQTPTEGDQMEFLYTWIVQFFKLFNFPSVAFFGFAAFVTLALFFDGIRKHGDFFFLSVLLFVEIGLYTTSFNIVRHFIALGIIFDFGLDQIKKRNLKGYLLVVLIASLFHLSALFCLPLYFIAFRKLSTFYSILGVILAFALNSGFLIDEVTAFMVLFLPGKYAGYVQYLPTYIHQLDEPFFLKILNNIDKVIICIILFINRKKLMAINPANLILINLFYFNLVFALFSRGIGPLQRLGFYFQIFSILAIPLLVNLGKSPIQRILIAVGIGVAYFAYFIAIILSKNVGEIIPYQTIFH
jgi:transmembrane protein EpsG